MEGRIGFQNHFFSMPVVNFLETGKRGTEWDIKDWKWDGDLFIARPVNPVSFDCANNRPIFPHGNRASVIRNSSSYYDEVKINVKDDKAVLEKRQRIVSMEDSGLNGGEGGLDLKLGGQNYQIAEKPEHHSSSSGTNLVICLVKGCGTDLSKAKDYHRRHKVCEIHAKASRVNVGNILQRFCQRCSRFHVLEEFDEGKRSCHRRLAGHNIRRRKANPNFAACAGGHFDGQIKSYLLIRLLKILCNMHGNEFEHPVDHTMLSSLLRRLVNSSGGCAEYNVLGISHEPQYLLNDRGNHGDSEAYSAVRSRPPKQRQDLPPSQMPFTGVLNGNGRNRGRQNTSAAEPNYLSNIGAYTDVTRTTATQKELNKFDLNHAYMETNDGFDVSKSLSGSVHEDVVRVDPSTMCQELHQSSGSSNDSLDIPKSSPTEVNEDAGPADHPSIAHQESHHSDRSSVLASIQSPSTSSEGTESLTNRIVFKLFGKKPKDFPPNLREQIIDWLSNGPTDIEGYIRPGCVVLSIYLCQDEAAWEELCSDLTSSLNRLLEISNDLFWTTGWVYIRVQQQVAFICNGQVLIDAFLPSHGCSKILSIKPIAVPPSKRVEFLVKGFNLSCPETKLLCALEGEFLFEAATESLIDGGAGSNREYDEPQYIRISCSVPSVNGRGFMEVEDPSHSSSFFPFIVAEDDVCSEIRSLESTLELKQNEIGAKNQAMHFLHEMGWLLHRAGLRSRLGELDPNTELFPFKKFKWLMEFAMDHDWPAVVKKLLDILHDRIIGPENNRSSQLGLLEMHLLHRAVERNSRPLVELLLGYMPERLLGRLFSESEVLMGVSDQSFLFRPDDVGPACLTPLHIAAGKDGSEDVLDALTDDPWMVGLRAWKTARDSTGFTPEEYAHLLGHFSYTRLIQDKINRRFYSFVEPVVSNSHVGQLDCVEDQKQKIEATPSVNTESTGLKNIQQSCKICE